MRVRELRIGNWVTNKEGVPVTVLVVDRAMILIDSSRDPKCFNTNNVHVSTLLGISLTPELLEKAGCIRFADCIALLIITSKDIRIAGIMRP